MFIIIPVPGKRLVAVEGSVWKFVTCTNCQQDYAYQLRLEAIGEDVTYPLIDEEESTQRAIAHAEKTLLKQSRNLVRPVPCPHCGFYQDDMVVLLEEGASGNIFFAVGMLVTVLALVPLLFSIPNLWIVTVVGVLIGLLLMAYSEFATSRFNPNTGDPEPRKAKGRKIAVWGEQLAEMLAASAEAKSADTGESPE